VISASTSTADDLLCAGVARISAADCAPWAGVMQPGCLATLAGGADCVVTVRPDPEVSAGCVAMDEVMQRNLHLCPGETYSFRWVLTAACVRTCLRCACKVSRRCRAFYHTQRRYALTSANPAFTRGDRDPCTQHWWAVEKLLCGCRSNQLQ